MDLKFPKIAFLVATGQGNVPYERYSPSPMMQIADKPILAYIIEYLHSMGCKEIHLILHHQPEKIETYFGNGERFGVTLYTHLAKDKNHPLLCVGRQLKLLKSETILFGQGDLLIELTKTDSCQFIDKNQNFLGWKIQAADQLLEMRELPKTKTHLLLSTTSINSLMSSNFEFLKSKNSRLALVASCHLVQEGVYLSRGVTLHPTAKIIAPVFIGENCHIASGVTLGPNVVLENHCYIDQNSKLKESLVFQNSYIGDGLEIEKSLIDRNLLIKADDGHHIQITDDFILSEITLPNPSSIVEKWVARLLLVLCSPLFLFLKIKKTEAVLLPARERLQTFDLYQFQGLFKHFATLINISKGQMHFVGIAPRTKQEIEALAPDWKKLVLQSKSGIVTLSDTRDADTLYAEEAYYTVNQGFWFDLNLFFKRIWYAIKKTSSFRSEAHPFKLRRGNTKHTL